MRAAAGCASVVVLTILFAQAPSGAGPRIAAVPENQRSSEQRTLAAQFVSAGMPNAVATYLHHPALVTAILPQEHYVSSESTLPARHRELLGLRTAWLTRSNYLWAHHAAPARNTGVTAAELRRIAEGPDARGWDAFEAVLLRAADELHVDSFVSDATWRALTARYDTNQIVDLIDSVGAFTLHAGAINSLGIEIEPDLRDRLPSEVKYAVAATRTNERLLGKAPRIPPIDPTDPARPNGNVFRTFVRNPPGDRPRGAVTGHIRGGTTLTPRHRELLLMRIGALCRSEYEWAAHSRAGRQTGMTDADVLRIAGVAGAGSGGDAVEAALLRTTDELYRDDVVSDRTWTELAATFDTRQLLDILIAVGGYRAVSMAINSAGVQLDANMADFRFPPSLR